MKFSYNYLKKLLKFKQTPLTIAELIELHITEVESIITSAAFTKVVVGEILEIRDHPDADKLHLTKVDIGTDTLDIICGADNIAIGQKVPVALVGAILPGGLEIKEATIRGKRSFGMICSEAELGLPARNGERSEVGGADKSEGILVLKPFAIPGTPAEEILETNTDAIIEPKILSNRPDLMSYIGMARELAAVLNIDFKSTVDTKFTESKTKTLTALKIKVEDSKLCPRYLGRVVKNVAVKPSPKWMQDVLNASGLRPVNNIVDIANYVMLELGNPIHTFDYAKVGEREVVIRRARDGEVLLGLDGIERKLDEKTLIIADNNKPIAIAGIIGGEHSGVGEFTKDLVIEVAAFDKLSLRRTAKRLGVATDAELHFERGVDPLSTEIAMARTLNLLQTECPDCEILAGNIDVRGKLPAAFSLLRVSTDAINKLLGVTISAHQMAGILKRLDLSTEIRRNDLVVKIPSYRQDIVGMNDIAEEVLRIYGSDQVPYQMPKIIDDSPVLPEIESAKMRVKEILVRLGFTEVYTHPFDNLNSDKKKIAILNPLNEHWTYLVDDLSANLLTLPINRPIYKIFEIGTIFSDTGDTLPAEQQQLMGLAKAPDAYRVVRGVMDALLAELGISGVWEEYIGYAGLQFKVDGNYLGHIKACSANQAEFALLIDKILPHIVLAKSFVELVKFPAVKMDMAFIIAPEIRMGELQKTIREIDKLIDRVELFDVFELPEGKGRSIAFHIELRAEDRTLTSTERDEIHTRIVETAKAQFGAQLRD